MKDIARQAFDGEIFIDRANERFARFQDDAIIGIVRNGAAGSKRASTCAAPAAHAMVNGIVMNQGGPPPALGAKPFRQHAQTCVEFLTRVDRDKDRPSA